MKYGDILLGEIRKILSKGKKFRIVFLGDSITSTEWVHPNWREIVEYVLKEELQKKMGGDWERPSWNIRGINSGLNGAATSDLLDHLESDVFFYKPEMVICIAGKNDMHYKVSPVQHKENVKKLIEKITTKVPYFVFCTSTPSLTKEFNDGYKVYVELVRSLFPCPRTCFVDLFKEYQKFDLTKFFTFISEGNEVVGFKPGDIDTLHPNQLGNAYIAKVILKEVFGLKFDPKRYIKQTREGKMYPGY
jgi:lysophospholipase L1-like esterase